MTEFGQTIRELRKERKLSQITLAKGVCSQSVLSRIENGEEIPNVLVMHELCKKLGVSLDRLLHYGKSQAQEIQDFLDLLWIYFRAKDWELLGETIGESAIAKNVQFIEDKQELAFFEGFLSCIIEENYAKAIEELTLALNLSYYPQKKFLSFMEVIILSARGFTYHRAKQIVLAEGDFYKAMESVYYLPKDTQKAELSILFYYFADFLFSISQFSESQKLIKQGIRWLRNFESFFFLEELLQLQAKILLNDKEDNEAEIYLTFAQDLNRLCQFLS